MAMNQVPSREPVVEKARRRISALMAVLCKKRNPQVGREIVAQPVDIDFHGKSQCSAGWSLKQTNKFDVK